MTALSPLDGETVSLRRFSNDAEVAGEETGVVERGLSGRNSTPCLVQHFCPFPLCLGHDALGYEAGARIFSSHTIHRQPFYGITVREVHEPAWRRLLTKMEKSHMSHQQMERSK